MNKKVNMFEERGVNQAEEIFDSIVYPPEYRNPLSPDNGEQPGSSTSWDDTAATTFYKHGEYKSRTPQFWGILT